MKHFYPALFLFFIFGTGISIPAFSQKIIQLSVQFKKNKYILTDEAKSILEKVNDTVGDRVVDKIVVKGYTDSDADSVYNARLSENRCRAVKNFLVGQGIDSTIMVTAAYGEYFPLVENSDENNKSKNRRVDLIITTHGLAYKPKKDSCGGDTLVEISNGVLMLVNKCRYKANDYCLSISIERHEEADIKFSRFKMKLGLKNHYTVKNKRVSYYANVYCNDTSCGHPGAALYIPYYDVEEKKVTVREYDSLSGDWVKHKEPKIKSVKKKSYAIVPYDCKPGYKDDYHRGPCELEIFCGHHVDPCGCKQSKMVFRDGIKILEAKTYGGSEARISNDSNTVFFNADYGISQVTLVYKNDTTRIKSIETGALGHGRRHIKSCKNEKWFLFMKFYPKCTMWRKYKFKKADIKLQKQKPWNKITQSS